jgi:hypothetical protein
MNTVDAGPQSVAVDERRGSADKAGRRERRSAGAGLGRTFVNGRDSDTRTNPSADLISPSRCVKGLVMPSAEPTRFTDPFWLAAHDGVKGARLIGDWSLGIGLATGLLAELVHGGWCQLWKGSLFRKTASPPKDPALLALFDQMKADEKDWPPPPPPPPSPRTYVGDHVQVRPGQVWPPAARAELSKPPVPQETRPSGRGHDLREWMSWLVYEERAETLVGERLLRSGLVSREERRRMLGGTTVRYVPCDSVVTGFPASGVRTAVQRGLDLPCSGLFLAGLFLATGLHEHALATLTPAEHSALLDRLKGLDEQSRELLKVAHAAVGDAAIR